MSAWDIQIARQGEWREPASLLTSKSLPSIRGGVSAAFEPIDAPVFELREACERNGVELRRTRSPAPETGAGEFVLCSVGQTLLCQGEKNGE